MPVYRIPAKVGTEMRLYIPLLCAKLQGNRIWRSSFIAVFVSVRQEEEKEEKNEETEPIFEVAYLENALSDFSQIWNVECCSWRACPQKKSSCFIKEAQSYGGAKIAFSSCQYTHGCYAPASWAARHTTVCLYIYIMMVVKLKIQS